MIIPSKIRDDIYDALVVFPSTRPFNWYEDMIQRLPIFGEIKAMLSQEFLEKINED